MQWQPGLPELRVRFAVGNWQTLQVEALAYAIDSECELASPSAEIVANAIADGDKAWLRERAPMAVGSATVTASRGIAAPALIHAPLSEGGDIQRLSFELWIGSVLTACEVKGFASVGVLLPPELVFTADELMLSLHLECRGHFGRSPTELVLLVPTTSFAQAMQRAVLRLPLALLESDRARRRLGATEEAA